MKLVYRHVRFTNEDRPSWSIAYDCVGVSGPNEGADLGWVDWDCLQHRWLFASGKFIEFTTQHLADIHQFMRLLPKPKVEA